MYTLTIKELLKMVKTDKSITSTIKRSQKILSLCSDNNGNRIIAANKELHEE